MPRLMCPLIPGHQIASDQDPNNLQPIHSQATLRGVHVFRVFANIGVVSFHSMLYWAVIEGTTLQDTLQIIDDSTVLKIAAFANLGVDAFLVLSGFLAALAMKARADHFSFKGYMYGRIKRIMIPYLFIILLIYLTIPHGESTPRHMKANHDVIFAYCPTTLPLSFLLLNNFIGFGGCGLHLWSISVQMHLYVLFGLIIKVLPRDPRKRMPKLMKIAGCSFILCSAVRFALGLFYQIEIPVPAFGHQNLSEKSKGDAFRFYHTMYFLTTSRLCNFMAGVLLAASMDTASMAKLHRIRPRWIISSTSIIFYYNIVTSIKYNQEPMRPWRFSPVWASLVFHGSPLASLLFALLLCCCVMHERPQSWMATGYIYQVMKYLSGASYWIYLLHPFVMYWGQSLMHGLQLEFLVTHMRTQMPIVCFFVILTAAYLGSLCVYAMLRLCQKILIHIEKLPGDLKKSQSRSSLNDIQTKEMKQP